MIQKLLFCCRHCVYWCILLVGMSVFFLTLWLAAKDLYTVSELKDKSDAMEDIPSFEIDCLQTCMIRYTEDRGMQCCDSQTGLCVEKVLCKTNYQGLQSITMQVLKEDACAELMVAAVALMVVVFIPFHQYRKQHSQDTLEDKIFGERHRQKTHKRSQQEWHQSLLTENLFRQAKLEGRYLSHSWTSQLDRNNHSNCDGEQPHPKNDSTYPY